MARYAIKHTESGKILEYDHCCEEGAMVDEKEQILSWATKEEAENQLKSIPDTISVWDAQDEAVPPYKCSASEFKVAEL